MCFPFSTTAYLVAQNLSDEFIITNKVYGNINQRDSEVKITIETTNESIFSNKHVFFLNDQPIHLNFTLKFQRS